MQRRKLLSIAALTLIGQSAYATPKLINFRFGILRTVDEGVFEFTSLTRRIPLKTKETGFRFGIGFDNPTRETIEWYEVMHLPEETKVVSGNFKRAGGKSLRTKTFRSNQASVIDDFWFDEGDPLGIHIIELNVNGALVFSVEFEVVKSK